MIIRLVVWSSVALTVVGHLAVLDRQRIIGPNAGSVLLTSLILTLALVSAIAIGMWRRGMHAVPPVLACFLGLFLLGRTAAFDLADGTGGGGWELPYTAPWGVQYTTHREAVAAIDAACAVADGQGPLQNIATFGSHDVVAMCRRGAALPPPRFSVGNLKGFAPQGVAVLSLALVMVVGVRPLSGWLHLELLRRWPVGAALVGLHLLTRVITGGRQLESGTAVSLVLTAAILAWLAFALHPLAARLESLRDAIPRPARTLAAIAAAEVAVLLAGSPNLGLATVFIIALVVQWTRCLPAQRVFALAFGAALLSTSLAVDHMVGMKLQRRVTAVQAARLPAPPPAEQAQLADLTHQARTGYSLAQRAGWLGHGYGRTPAMYDRNYSGDTQTFHTLAVQGLPLWAAVVGLTALLLVSLWALVREFRGSALGTVLAGQVAYLAAQSALALALPAGFTPLAGLSNPFTSSSGSYMLLAFGTVSLAVGLKWPAAEGLIWQHPRARRAAASEPHHFLGGIQWTPS